MVEGYDSEELKAKAERIKKFSIVLMAIGIVIVVVSLIYEFIYKGQESLIGVIIRMASILISLQSMLIGVQLVSEIGERIREVREKETGKDISIHNPFKKWK